MKSISEGGTIATHGSTTLPAAAFPPAPCSQASVSTRPAPSSAAAARMTSTRSSASGRSGRSMPVTRSVVRRNGVEEGHDPMQMPQATQRSGLTTTSWEKGRPSLRGTSVIAE